MATLSAQPTKLLFLTAGYPKPRPPEHPDPTFAGFALTHRTRNSELGTRNSTGIENQDQEQLTDSAPDAAVHAWVTGLQVEASFSPDVHYALRLTFGLWALLRGRAGIGIGLLAVVLLWWW